MAMADVKLVCGACGAAVEPGAGVCGSCGSGLRYPAMRAPEGEKERPRPSRRKKGEESKRGTEPWMVVAGISVLLLLAYIVYSTVTAPPAPVAGSVPGVAPGAASGPAPIMGPRVDLGPLEGAVERNPTDPAALLQLANALHDGGLWDRAAATYERYLAGTPGNPDARVDMAICYFESSKANSANREAHYARAVAEMQRVMKEHPRHQAAAFNLGVVILHSGDVTGANAWFKRAAEIDPSTPLGQRATTIMQQHSFTN